MELIGKISLFIHIFAGASTLIAGPIALFFQKKTKQHRIAGKVFTYSMMAVIATSVFKFLRVPHEVGYQFLFAISILVAFNIWQGVRSIQFMKGKQPGQFDRTIIWLFIFTGVAMVNAAVWYYLRGVNMALPILFGVFGTIVLASSLTFRRFLVAGNIPPRWWLRIHIKAMMGAFVASTTAFTVNAINFVPFYVQWFGPAVLLQPLVYYFLRERKLLKKDLGKPFEKQPVLA